MSNQTPATLPQRLQDGGDPFIWDEFFERYWRLIYAAARSEDRNFIGVDADRSLGL